VDSRSRALASISWRISNGVRQHVGAGAAGSRSNAPRPAVRHKRTAAGHRVAPRERSPSRVECIRIEGAPRGISLLEPVSSETIGGSATRASAPVAGVAGELQRRVGAVRRTHDMRGSEVERQEQGARSSEVQLRRVRLVVVDLGIGGW